MQLPLQLDFDERQKLSVERNYPSPTLENLLIQHNDHEFLLEQPFPSSPTILAMEDSAADKKLACPNRTSIPPGAVLTLRARDCSGSTS